MNTNAMSFDTNARLAVCEMLEITADVLAFASLKVSMAAQRVARSRNKKAALEIAQCRIRQKLDRRTSVHLRQPRRRTP